MERSYEDIKREAYHKALHFKNTGLDQEVIYARLEKQGYPEVLAQEVACNVFMKKLQDNEERVMPKMLNEPSVLAWLIRKLFK